MFETYALIGLTFSFTGILFAILFGLYVVRMQKDHMLLLIGPGLSLIGLLIIVVGGIFTTLP